MNEPRPAYAFAVALSAWTTFVSGLLVLYPARLPLVPCARLAGIGMDPVLAAQCQAVLNAANDQIFRFRTLPMIAGVAAGYVAIVAVAVLARRSRRRA